MAQYTWQLHSCSILICSLIRKGTCVMLRDNDNDNRGHGDVRNCENTSCNRCCCKRCCPVCPPEQRSCNLSGVQVQLCGAARALLENNSNVVFDKIVNQSNPRIQYNDMTGEFTYHPMEATMFPGRWLLMGQKLCRVLIFVWSLTVS